jgi:DNA-binding SARP family transcriptional activator
VHRPELHLFAGPYVVLGGRRRELPEGSKRLLVFVALQGGRVDRRAAAGTLWSTGDDARAAGNLRSALWRLRGAGIDVLESNPSSLRLRPGTVVDLEVRSAWAARLTEGRASEDDLREGAWRSLSLDLLPGWDEAWVHFERERVRQQVLHGLEALSRLLMRSGRSTEAVAVAAATVRADPLRESAQRALIEAHLTQGDVDLAWCQYLDFRELLAHQFRVGPSAELTALVEGRRRPPWLPAPPAQGPPGRPGQPGGGSRDLALAAPRPHAGDDPVAPTPRRARPGPGRLP